MTLGAAPSLAATIAVNLNGLGAGNFIFDFQFINGDATSGNNAVTIGGFTASSLTLGSLTKFGPVAGTNLVSGLTLTDGPMTEVQQAFTATAAPASIVFQINYTGNYAPPGIGDAFTFAVTDTSLNSTRSVGNGALLEVDITGPNSAIQTFPADRPFGGFGPQVIPEPATFGLALLPLLSLGLLRLMRRPA